LRSSTGATITAVRSDCFRRSRVLIFEREEAMTKAKAGRKQTATHQDDHLTSDDTPRQPTDSQLAGLVNRLYAAVTAPRSREPQGKPFGANATPEQKAREFIADLLLLAKEHLESKPKSLDDPISPWCLPLTFMSDGSWRVDGKPVDMSHTPWRIDDKPLTMQQQLDLLHATHTAMLKVDELIANDAQKLREMRQKRRASYAKRRSRYRSVASLVEEIVPTLSTEANPTTILAAIEKRYSPEELTQIVGKAGIEPEAIKTALRRYRSRVATSERR
jgi:hypothetical protein